MAEAQHSASTILDFDDVDEGIRTLTDVFGFEEVVLYRDEAGVVAHCELRWGTTIVMPSPPKDKPWSPNNTSLYLTVDDPDSHHDRSVAAGLEITMPLTDQDYGSREYGVRDASGNHYTFGTYRPGSPS